MSDEMAIQARAGGSEWVRVDRDLHPDTCEVDSGTIQNMATGRGV